MCGVAKWKWSRSLKAPCFLWGGSMFYWKPYCTTSFMNKSCVLVSFSQDSCHKWWFRLGFAGNVVMTSWTIGLDAGRVTTSGAVCSGKASEYLQRRSGLVDDAENVGENIRFVKSCPDSAPKKGKKQMFGSGYCVIRAGAFEAGCVLGCRFCC